MKILLVRPAPSDETIGLQHVMIVEPLELEVLAALRRAEDQAVLADLLVDRRHDIEWFLKKHRPQVVAVTGYITNVPAMIDLCRRAKRFDPSIATVVGGVHCEVCPEHFDHPDVDFRVVRNATRSFGPLLDHICGQGELPAGVVHRGQRVQASALPAFDFYYPLPDRGLTAGQRHRYFYIFHDRVALLKTAFGCPYKCSFCFCRAITGDRYHPRPLDEVLDELASLNEREIYIVDDDFLLSVERLRGFLDGLSDRGLDKHFLIYGRADFIAEHRELMRRFVRQGLRTVIVGFESFLQKDLDRYGKQSGQSHSERALRVCQELGIDVFATIVVPPSWSVADFDLHAQKFAELGINYVNLQPLTPLPGTGLAVDDKDLLLAPGDFERWDLAHVALRPQHMSVRAFYQQIIRLYMRTLYRPAYLKGYLRRYPRRMLGKMIAGTLRVRKQYLRKLREARRFG